MTKPLSLLIVLLEAQAQALRLALAQQSIVITVVRSLSEDGAIDAARLTALTAELGGDETELKAAADAAKAVVP